MALRLDRAGQLLAGIPESAEATDYESSVRAEIARETVRLYTHNDVSVEVFHLLPDEPQR